MPTCVAPGAVVVKKIKSPASNLSRSNLPAGVVLLVHRTWKIDLVQFEDVADEAAAVEAVSGASPPKRYGVPRSASAVSRMSPVRVAAGASAAGAGAGK
jgi:hypothetical protein